MNRKNQDFILQTNYQKWLDENKVQVQSKLFKTTTENVVAGWGCVATSFIKDGTILFEIPREACFTSNEYSSDSHGDGSSSDDDGDDDDADVDEAITSDTQKKLALKLLRDMENNRSDTRNVTKWKPFLDLLTPHPLPWTWPKQFREKVLLGTELEKVVERKVERVRKEYKKIIASSATATKGNVRNSGNKSKMAYSSMQNLTYQEYLRATSLVASHANPWFGVSIVPFNTTLNCPNVGEEANVEFDLVKKKMKVPLSNTSGNSGHDTSLKKSKGKVRRGIKTGNKNFKEKTISKVMIVGRAMKDIQPGQELFQQYGDSIAELVYRCGFAPCPFERRNAGKDSSNSSGEGGVSVDICGENFVMEGDVVSFSIRDIVRCVEDVLGQTKSIRKEQNGVLITSLLSRMEALKKSGAIDESPWDGLNGWEHVTAEISLPSKSYSAAHLKSDIHVDHNGNNNSDKRRRKDIYSQETENSVFDDGGISKLIGICLVLMVDEDAWQRASTTLKEAVELNGKDGDDDDDEESRSDDIAASAILASIANLNASQSLELRQMAMDVGMDDNDPWRALLLYTFQAEAKGNPNDSNNDIDGMKKKQKLEKIDDNATSPSKEAGLPWNLAIVAARLAIQKRMEILLEGGNNCKSLLEEITRGGEEKQITAEVLPSSEKKTKDDRFQEEEMDCEEKRYALTTMQVLRNVEKSILLRAMEVLDDTSAELMVE